MRIWPREEAIDEALAAALAPGQAVRTEPGDLTWDRLCDRLARAAGSAPLGPVVQRLALWQAVQDAAAGTPWAQVADRAGLLASTGEFVDDAERAGVDGAELAARTRRGAADATSGRVAFLAQVLARFTALTATHGASAARRQAIATAHLAAGGALGGVVLGDEIVVQPRLPWTPAHVAFVVALARRAHAAGGRVTVALPWADAQPSVYAGVEPTLRAFEAAHDVPGLELAWHDVGADAPADVHALVAALFATEPPAAPLAAPSVTLVETAERRGQWRELAARARRAVDAGTPPEQIVVAARHPGEVAAPLAAALERVGLRLDDRRGASLHESALGRLTLAALAVVEAGLPREPTLALLGARATSVRGVSAVRVRASGVADLGPASRAALRRVTSYAGLAEALDAALAPLEALPEVASIARHTRALGDALEALGVWRRARTTSGAPGDDDDRDPLAARLERSRASGQAAAAALETLLGELPRAALTLGLGAPLPRARFAALLAHVMAGVRLRPLGARGGAVRLVAPRDLLGRGAHVVFVPELIDGVTPARGGDDGFYGAAERHRVDTLLGARRLARPSSEADEASADERLELLAALGATRQALVLLAPRRVGDRPALPSPLVLQLGKLAPDVARHAPPPSPVPSVADAQAPADVLARVALEVYADPALRVSVPEAAPGVRDALAQAAHAAPARLARIARLVEIERARWRFFARTAAPHAFVGAPGPLPLLATRGGLTQGAPISASDLDTLANCGFAFFARRILGVGEPDEPGAAPEARDVGTVAHRALERYHGERLRRGAPPAADAAARAELEAALDAALADYDAKDPAGHPGLWALERDRLAQRLWRLVERDAARPGWTPAHLELGFGGAKDELPALRVGTVAHAVWVSGRIDRIDRSTGGGGGTDGDALLVLDYKAGRVDREQKKLTPGVAGVQKLQLPIYAVAARELLGATRVDAQLVSVRDARPTDSLAATHGEAYAGLLDDVVPGRVAELAARIEDGTLTVAPVDCAYCAYRTVCRVVALDTDDDEGAA